MPSPLPIWKSFDFQGHTLDVLDAFKDQKHVFCLNSSQYHPHYGRYSFIGFDPFQKIVHTGSDTLSRLKKAYDVFSHPRWIHAQTPLTAGIVGCLSYDYGLSQEPVHLQARDDLNLPDCFFGFYDLIITIDHFTHKLIITSSGLPERNDAARQERAEKRLAATEQRILARLRLPAGPCVEIENNNFPALNTFHANLSKEQYCRAVKKALAYIRDGDIYQVNLSQRFTFELDKEDADIFTLYRILSDVSPVPFGSYMDGGSFKILCNSPERFVRLQNRLVQAKPMKGTRPRGSDTQRNEQNRRELVNSIKDKAELLMITDLLRNDLGRVCDYGSIKVKDMRALEQYQYVYQMTSTIEGVLQKNKDAFDLLRACFPGGSITGCPKIRSMNIIEELEPTRRSMYTGTLGYINFNGDADFNILIRTLIACRNKLYFQVGSGIVADSTPDNEYQETLDKAQAIQMSLEVMRKMGKPSITN